MKPWIPQAGSVLSAFAASLCCIGPILAVTLGVGGLGAAASLEVYRPYLLAFTFACLGIAFYTTYGRERTCDKDGSCEPGRAPQWPRVMLWVATVAAILFAAVPNLLSLFV